MRQAGLRALATRYVKIGAPRWRLSAMNMVTRSLILCIPLLSFACSDLGNQPEAIVLASAFPLSQSDTIQISILNAYHSDVYLTACNFKLTCWIQQLSGALWQDRSSLNAGPCLSIYPSYIILAPNKVLSQPLSDASLKALSPGDYRIRIEYRLSQDTTIQNSFTNDFQLNR